MDEESNEDASPTSSRFSSCEGSEFERYCSANSNLGSSSVCSSSYNPVDFLESLKNAGFGDDFASETSNSCENRLNSSIDCSRTDFEVSGGLGFAQNEEISSEEEENRVSLNCFSNLRHENELGSIQPINFKINSSFNCPRTDFEESGGLEFAQNEGISSGSGVSLNWVRNLSHEKDLGSFQQRNSSSNCPRTGFELSGGSGFAQNEGISSGNGVSLNWVRNLRPENELGYFQLMNSSSNCQKIEFEESEELGSAQNERISSGDEHSDGEGEGNGVSLNWVSNLRHGNEKKNENPLLMGSSVAFGNDDWSEYERETEVTELGSLRLMDHQINARRTDLELPEVMNLCSEGLGLAQNEIILSGDEHSDGGGEGDGVSLKCVSNLKQIGKSGNVNYNDNTLLVNSSVAFGNDDWGGYERETVVTELGPLQRIDHKINGVLKLENFKDNSADRSSSSDESGSFKTAEKWKAVDDALYDGDSSSHIFDTPTREFETVEDVLENRIHELKDTAVTIEAVEKIQKFDSSEFFEEMVLEMEEILLDSGEGAGARASQTDRKSYNLRDGSSTASTSGTDGIYAANQLSISIDRIEVVGAKHKKGDVSFGERLVGVKEYTVYLLKIKSGKEHWQAECRYRDFLALYHQLKALFRDHGLILPSPWNNVVRESRNLFGNSSSTVISQRSILIEDCLNSVLHFRFSSGHPSPLIWFLHRPNQSSVNIPVDDVSELGKTISLVLEVKPRKSLGQLLESQRYLCAACHRRLDSAKILAQGLISKLGWEKNRFCEYTGQLFCSVCHANDYSILPARVLHHWDFSRYPVSQLAKAFLDSIYDQPMLCVSAVNPFLLSKVPALQQVMGIRKRISSMLPCILCPFRRSIQRGLGSRRYLLEHNDFFAMRDLVDLSKGVFSGLPTLVETVEKKILTHISQQCLICYDAGTPCAARGSCIDPASVVFPFQESEAVQCSSCQLLFHQQCILKMGRCPCGKLAPIDGRLPAGQAAGRDGDFELRGFVDESAESSDAKALSGFFSDLIAKARPEKLWKTRSTQPVILMSSLTRTAVDL